MNSNTKTYVAVFVALVVIVALVYFMWIRPGLQDEVVEVVEVATPVPEPTPTPTLPERLSERLQGTTLRTSDVIVRELVSELSANPKLAAWLANDDLVRRFCRHDRQRRQRDQPDDPARFHAAQREVRGREEG